MSTKGENMSEEVKTNTEECCGDACKPAAPVCGDNVCDKCRCYTKGVFGRLDRMSLLLGRLVIYPLALAILLVALYVPTYAYMHSDDHQMVLHWQSVPPGAGTIAEVIYRSDFDMSQEQADAFLKFMEEAESTDTYTLDGLRFQRSYVSRAHYHDRSRFPADVIEQGEKLWVSGRKYVGEMLTVQ